MRNLEKFGMFFFGFFFLIILSIIPAFIMSELAVITVIAIGVILHQGSKRLGRLLFWKDLYVVMRNQDIEMYIIEKYESKKEELSNKRTSPAQASLNIRNYERNKDSAKLTKSHYEMNQLLRLCKMIDIEKNTSEEEF